MTGRKALISSEAGVIAQLNRPHDTESRMQMRTQLTASERTRVMASGIEHADLRR